PPDPGGGGRPAARGGGGGRGGGRPAPGRGGGRGGGGGGGGGGASAVARVGRSRAPLAAVAAGGATRGVEHRALQAHQQAQQLREAGAVQGASGAIRGRVHGDQVPHARDRHAALAPQLAPEHGPRRAARDPVPHQPG